ncbi:MAG: hypothetical protein ACRDHS_03440 [Actinomycetota bacterium]
MIHGTRDVSPGSRPPALVWPHLSGDGSTTAVGRVRVSREGRFRGRHLPAFIVSDGDRCSADRFW